VAIEKEPSKATVAGGGVHPLTRYVMNYLVFLADYEGALDRINQQQGSPERSWSIGWANNTHYVARKLAIIPSLGDDDGEAQDAARRHVEAYVRVAWGKVLKAIAAADGVEGGDHPEPEPEHQRQGDGGLWRWQLLRGQLHQSLRDWKHGGDDRHCGGGLHLQRLERCLQRNGRLLGRDERGQVGHRHVRGDDADHPGADGHVDRRRNRDLL